MTIIFNLLIPSMHRERGERENSKRKLNKDFGNAIITRMCVLENFKHFNLFFSEIKKKISWGKVSRKAIVIQRK